MESPGATTCALLMSLTTFHPAGDDKSSVNLRGREVRFLALITFVTTSSADAEPLDFKKSRVRAVFNVFVWASAVLARIPKNTPITAMERNLQSLDRRVVKIS